jgi:excinuclease ABC subunit A
MGPGGGADGGRIVVTGTPARVAEEPDSVTGQYLREHVRQA